MNWIIKRTNAITGAIGVFIVMSLLVWFVPESTGNKEGTALLLTISTFLFSALSGFFISKSNKRYNALDGFWSKEDALFFSLFQTARLTKDQKFIETIREQIDGYYITLYSVQIDFDYKWSQRYYLPIWDAVRKLDIPSIPSPIVGNLLNTLQQIEHTRNGSQSEIGEKMSVGQWILLIVLAGVIVTNLLIMRTGDLYSSIAIIFFVTALSEVLLILWDLERLDFGAGDSLGVESGQEIFELLGKPRFYHKVNMEVQEYDIPEHVTEYRLGTHGKREEFEIELVQVKKEEV